MADEVTTSSFLDSMKSATVTTGKVIGGGAEIVLAGAYNTAVEAVAGLVSIPAVFSSVDKAVAIQDSVKERWGYEIKSEGAQTIFETASEVIPDELPELYEEKKKQVQIAIEENLGPEAGLVIGIGVEAGSEIFGGVAKKAGGSIAKGAEAAKDAKEAAQKAKKGTADVSNEAAADCKLEKADGKPGDKGGSESKADGKDESETNTKPQPVTVIKEKYGTNEAVWKVDEQGRPISVEAKLDNTYQTKRSSAEKDLQQKVGGDARLSDDDGGHIIGHRFMSDQGDKNLFPQNANFNRSGYKKMENEWDDWTDEGFEVKLKVDLHPPGSDRPTNILSEYQVIDPKTGKTVFERSHNFKNTAGEAFDRVSKKDMLSYKD